MEIEFLQMLFFVYYVFGFFDMTSLSREKRSIRLHTIVEKCEILGGIEEDESCPEVSRKHSIQKQTLSE